MVVGPADQPAEVIVSRLGAGFGDMKSNVDRWRGMVGLEPIPDPKNQKQRQFIVGGQPGVLFDFEGPKGRMFVALAVLEQQQTAWFFRFQGTAATVAAQEPTFEQFLSSIQFGQ